MTERLGLTLLHRHYTIEEHERVVEYGHVATPWPVTGNNVVSAGRIVPRAWMFSGTGPIPYEYGFNSEGEDLYSNFDFPDGFVAEFTSFLEQYDLQDSFGICTMGEAEWTGRVERTIGRVSVTVPMAGLQEAIEEKEAVERILDDYVPSVWSFDCKIGLESATMKLARNCLWCPNRNC